jgi:hypothetical protein
MSEAFNKFLRIVDDDDDDNIRRSGLRIVVFCCTSYVGNITASGCLLRDKCEELIKGFADVDKDDFLKRG